MAKSDPAQAAHASSTAPGAVAAYLDMPEDRRKTAEANAALLVATAQRVADELPLGADVDDFRRVLVAEG
ncbi:MAG: hypothetical protein NW223_14365 [Hyphomicrobiaceae bacterium]|nr:hypothetical protein [Hyphomicrobiaceae bacterium]